MSDTLLFSPIRIGGNEFKNRVFVSPMCQYSAKYGFANHWHLVHIGSLAAGGPGLVMMEATGVCPEARITHGCLGLWSAEHAEKLRPIVEFCHAQGTKIGIQLAHAGRKAAYALPWKGGRILEKKTNAQPMDEIGWDRVAPSPVSFRPEEPPPVELTEIAMQDIADQFVKSTRLAVEIGFDVVELHFAHGYLAHEFLSPISNLRSDPYGGDLTSRMRWPLQLAKVVRAAVPPSKSLFVRISATDWVEGGWDLEQSVVLCRALQECGIDLIDVSSGGLSPLQKIPVQPQYQVPFAERIKKDVGIQTAAVGLITDPLAAEKLLKDQQADVVFLAREMLRDPHWPLRAAHQLNAAIAWPVQYERAKWA